MRNALAAFVGGTLMALAFCQNSHAQLSPGELHRSHAFLEGVENCNKCHNPDSEQMRSKCLTCHSEIRSRVESGRGLHAQPDYRDCENCHVEHHGRDFDLVFWKDGERGFKHDLAGYILRGKHAKATCRACHKPEFNRDVDQLQSRQKDLTRTFLGLDTNCVACHHDEHRGQLLGSCDRCHTFESWAPAPGFDHSNTKFVLTGRHDSTACAKCHQKMQDPGTLSDPEYLRFANVRHDNCVDCHKDSHAGRLGTRCENCHNTNGWQAAKSEGFDHAKTRYPLEGRHKGVSCEKCHPIGQSKSGLKFATCRDCHQDRHRGEFADRPRAGACEECHTVSGFSPALFAIDQHQLTRFMLREAHLAVPCSQCHGEGRGSMSTRTGQYTWAATRCQDCHKDVHLGQLAQIVDRSGCEECHTEATWSSIRFEHDSTGFALSGRHDSVGCAACHRGDTTGDGASRVTFAPLRSDCESCHRDVHRGQFAVSDTLPRVRCERCHTSGNWQATLFNHGTQTEYPLDGAHAKVLCASCHKPSLVDGIAFVDYQINDRSCRACHGTDEVKAKGATP